MRPPFDIRFSRSALLLIAIVSGLATFVILHGPQRRTPAQLAALAALRDRPHAPVATTTAAAASPIGSHSAGGSTGGESTGGGSSGGGWTGGGSGGGSSFSTSGGGATTAIGTGSSAQGATTVSTPTTTTSTPSRAAKPAHPRADLPKVSHVFEIMLSAPSYAAAFGHRSALTELKKLVHRGTLLRGYRSLGGGELADELAAVSGQAPNHETRLGCTSYTDFPTAVVANRAGLVPGSGCVYPDTALTIGDQVTASGASWGAYIADMGKDTCVHPNSGAVDDVLPAGADPGYDTRHNPFIYFHSLLDLGDCASDDVDLSRLPAALAHPTRTPAFAYLAANACADGDPTMAATSTTTTTTATTSPTTPSPTTATAGTTATVGTTATAGTTAMSSTTASTTTSATTTTPATTALPAGCPAGSPAGLAAENTFLKTWVPKILHSAAYRAHGALVIAFTRSGRATGHPTRAGALILSPDARRGVTLAAVQTPYSLLRFAEDALQLTPPLAHAKAATGLAAAVLASKQR